MTTNLRAADRDRILRTAIGRLAALRAYGVNRAHRELDQARDGLRGTDYEATHNKGGGSSPTEQAAMNPEGITPAQLDQALRTLETVCRTLGLGWTPHLTEGVRARPGRGKCPVGRCEDHWEAGVALKAAASRYTRWCRRCGDHRGKNGVSIPAPVLAAAYATRKLTRSGSEDWQHWSVKRAWSACGGEPTLEADEDAPTTDEAVTSPGAA